jgi:hypothetical protein
MNLGEVGNFISYAFAPASIVAPLGTVRIKASISMKQALTRLPFLVRLDGQLHICSFDAWGAVPSGNCCPGFVD